MEPSEACKQMVRDFEGCKLVAYPDPATGGAPYTIGIGHTGPDVSPGLTIPAVWAAHLFEQDVAKAAAAVQRLTAGVALTQGQLDALTSLVFNVGPRAFGASRMLQKILAGDLVGAGQEFLDWDWAAGRVIPALARRRAAERRLFLYG